MYNILQKSSIQCCCFSDKSPSLALFPPIVADVVEKYKVSVDPI